MLPSCGIVSFLSSEMTSRAAMRGGVGRSGVCQKSADYMLGQSRNLVNSQAQLILTPRASCGCPPPRPALYYPSELRIANHLLRIAYCVLPLRNTFYVLRFTFYAERGR